MTKTSKRSVKLSVVVCTYNRYDLLDTCIESIKAQDLKKNDYEILVIDNSPSSDDQVEFKAKYDLNDDVLYHIEPIKGLSNARNVGAKMSTGAVLCYIDDDAIAHTDWLRGILNAYEALPENAAVVGGRILPIWDTPRPDWFSTGMLGAVSVVDMGGETRVLGKGEWIAGANFCVTREAFEKVGGFDTTLGRKGGSNVLLSNEESNLVERIKKAGFCAAYAPEATVDHLVDRRRLKRSYIRKRMAWQAVSEILETPDTVFEDVPQSWEDVKAYMGDLPPELRTMRGIFESLDGPELTERQVGVQYSLIILLLGGFALEQQ